MVFSFRNFYNGNSDENSIIKREKKTIRVGSSKMMLLSDYDFSEKFIFKKKKKEKNIGKTQFHLPQNKWTICRNNAAQYFEKKIFHDLFSAFFSKGDAFYCTLQWNDLEE